MKVNEFKKEKVVRGMPLGRHEVTFDHLEYRVDENEDINGIWVHILEYRPLFIPFFEENNYQLDLLTEQLGVDSYDPDEINKAKGTVIVAHKYERNDEIRQMMFVNVSFNPRAKDTTANEMFA